MQLSIIGYDPVGAWKKPEETVDERKRFAP
jgi:hypothetical protein